MLFSHDTERSLACIVDLVNSVASRVPSGHGEQLPDLTSLADFVVRHDISGQKTPRNSRTYDQHDSASKTTAATSQSDQTT